MRHWLQQHSLILLVIVFATVLRLPLLNGSFWLDEAAQALESARPFSQQLQLAEDFQPPLLHLILFPFIRISTAEWWLRLWGALLPGMITIWATYKIGEKMTGKASGLIAALLLASSSFHIFYSQELRPYALPAMWAVLSWLFLMKAVAQKQHFAKEWFFFTLTTILGLYSSYLYPFLALAQIAWVICCQRHQLKNFALNILTAGAAFLPWLPSFLEQLRVGGEVRVNLPGWEDVVGVPQAKSLILVAGKFLFGVLDIELTPFFLLMPIIIAGLFGLSLFVIRKQLWRKVLTDKSLLLIFWLFVPLLTSWLVSFIVPVVQPKRVLYLLPAFYLLPAVMWQIELNSRPQRRPFNWYVILILLGINLFSTLQYHHQPRYQRENWRELHQEITETYPATSSVALFSFPGPFAPWRWYDNGRYPTLSTGELHVSAVPKLADRLKKVTDYEYVLLFEYLRDLTDPEDKIRHELWALGYREIDSFTYPLIGVVRVYSRSHPTASFLYYPAANLPRFPSTIER